MTIKPILWSHYTHKDGTCSVKLYVCIAGKVKYFPTEMRVTPTEWDAAKAQVKRAHPLSQVYNARIKKQRLELEQLLLEKGSLDALKPQKASSPSLLHFAAQYIDEVRRGLHDIQLSTCRNYQYTLDRLRSYARHQGFPDLSFDEIDLNFYFSFTRYLQEQHRCHQPGISKHIKNLKKFLNTAAERGLHSNTQHRNPAFRIYKKNISNKIWLNEEEVAALEALDLSRQPALERERDRWLLSYYFVMRYSDSIKVRRELIFEKDGNRYLRYRSQKTAHEVILPVKPKAYTLLEKYDFRFDGDTNQEANRKLKIIGAMAGLTDLADEGEGPAPKCSLLTTHTARRSAATQMYLQNVSLKVIADLGGWKRTETLKLYLLASGLDTAVMARELEFFK